MQACVHWRYFHVFCNMIRIAVSNLPLVASVTATAPTRPPTRPPTTPAIAILLSIVNLKCLSKVYQCPLMSFENLRFTGVLWILVESTSTKLVFLHRLFLASGIILVVFICLDSFNQILRIKIYKYYAIHVCHIFCVLRAKDWCKQMHTQSKFPRPTSSLRSDCVQIEVVQRLCTDCTLPGKRPPSGSRCSGFWGRSASQVFS